MCQAIETFAATKKAIAELVIAPMPQAPCNLGMITFPT